VAQERRDPAINAQALHALPPTKKTRGRPKKREMPALPNMPMSESERAIFEFWMEEFKAEHPDLSGTDELLLFLAGIEFIKYLRVQAEELETGKVISMARQHPGVNMRALLDQLSVTRKARTQGSKPSETDEKSREAKDFLMGFSSRN
jgi:hypothetical protein